MSNFDRPRRHSATPRIYVEESLIMRPTATVKVKGMGETSDYGWKDLVGNIVVKGVAANDPVWTAITGLGGMYGYEFSATIDKEVWLTFHVDHDYAEGTPIYLHAHWLNAAASPNTGNVRWGFEYTVAKGHQQQAFPAPSTIYVTQACNATRYMHHIAEVSLADVVPATNLEPDSLLMVRCFRDADNVGDTCTDAVFLLTMDCHYQTDKFSTKNKAPNFHT